MNIDLSEQIKKLASLAATPNGTCESAMKFSQAALNLVQAMATINAIKEA
jgi:hypothetical protein